MRVFGNGCFVGPEGNRYPSLKTCDEIDGYTKIQVEKAGGSEVFTWETVHANFNLGWKRAYSKWNADKSDFSTQHKEMQRKMDQFWGELGERFCRENNFKKILKAHEIEDECQAMHEDTLCVINHDNSGSMGPGTSNPKSKYNLAVAGAKTALKYLREHRLDTSNVQIQLWQNDVPGVQCVYKGSLQAAIPEDKWLSAHNQAVKVVRCEGVYAEGQFHGSVNILRNEVAQVLQVKNYPLVYYFFFTDGGNVYPMQQVQSFGAELKANKSLWTNRAGNPKLQVTIVTDCATVESLTRIKEEFDKLGDEIWQVKNWCKLLTSVSTDKWGQAMIEQFKLT